MGFSWSEEKEALFRFERDVLVSASAGTGKTTALVELFIRLLDGHTAYPIPVGPENILAITFTNKAAAEMRERIGQAALERLTTRAFDDVLQAATVTTYHAFCANLLREYAFEAGLAPDFDLLEEFDAERLREQAVVETLRECLERGDPDVTRLLHSRRLGALIDTLVHVLTVCYGPDLEEPDIPAELSRLSYQLRQDLAAYSEMLHEVTAHSAGTTDKARKGMTLWRRHWESLTEGKRLPDVSMTLEEGLDLFEEWKEVHAQWVTWPKDIRPLRPPLVAQRQRVAALFYQAKALPDGAAVVRVARRAFARLDEAKRAAFQLDFEDLQRRAIALLTERPAIREDLQRRIHVILVDEFQDTNATQLQLLSLLQRDAETAARMGLPPARRLLVGDRKQSIYRFRGADVSVFRAMERALLAGQGGGMRLHFRENFRSAPPLIAFFNGLFPRVMGGEGQEDHAVAYDAGDELVSGLVSPESSPAPAGPPPVEVIVLAGEEHPVSTRRQIEAEAVAARITALIQGPDGPRITEKGGQVRAPRFGDVCILLRRMTHAKHYERALSERGIPVVVTQSTGLLDRPEIRDLVMLMRVLVQPLDSVARLAVLRSPACLLSDEALVSLMRLPELAWVGESFSWPSWRSWESELPRDPAERARLARLVSELADLRVRLPLLPVSEVLETLLDRLDLTLILDQGEDPGRCRANVARLLELVRDWEGRLPGFDVAACVARLEEMERKAKREPEGTPPSDEQAVRMMTIHQAKGLEFPIVVLPDLAAKPVAARGDIFVSGGKRIGTTLFVERRQQRVETSFSVRGKEVEGEKEAAEYQRLLYVALTRARDYLVLSGDRKQARNAEGDEDKTPTWLDWVMNYVQNLPLVPTVHLVPDLDAARSLAGNAASPRTATDVLAHVPSDPPAPFRHEPAILGTFSISMLAELRRCERAFYLRQILDRSTLLWVEDEPEALPVLGDAPSPVSVGLWVHRYYEVRSPGEDASPEGWARFLVARGADPQSPWALEAAGWIARAGAFPEPETAALWRELPFLARVTLPSGRAIRLKGMVDAVGRRADGRLVLVDYKAASRKTDHESGYVFQLRAYAAVMAATTGLGFDQMDAHLAFLKDDAPWLPVSLSAEDMRAFGEDLDALVQRAFVLRRADLPPDLQDRGGCSAAFCRFGSFCQQKALGASR